MEPGWYIVSFIFFLFCLLSWYEYERKSLLAHSKAVSAGKEYPNNHHVIGVGYYHATCRKWHHHPWNEYREGAGYFWDGKWNAEPDLRQVSASEPEQEEIDRVNKLWRKADPDNMRRFWADVERGGFGYAVNRTRGS